MPRRVNDGIAALHARAAEQLEQDPNKRVTPAALPPSSNSDPFDFDRYCLEVAASRIAIGMRGKHHASTPRGRALAEKIAHKLKVGELLEVRQMQDSRTYNPPLNHKQSTLNLQRQQDGSMFPGSGLV